MMRSAVQLGFLCLLVVGVFLVQGNAERWCPFGGVEALYTYFNEGNMVCSLGVSNFYILGSVLLLTLLLRRAFCGYVCPIGAISEWLQKTASFFGLKPVRVPRRVDAVLSLLKYPIAAVIITITWKSGELLFRGFDPCYALLSRHGEDITFWAYIVAGAIVVGSLVVTVPFCRWLCPMAVVLNPLSRFGIARVWRSADACLDCGKCARSCPMAIPVDRVDRVTHARCTSCLDCVDACPEELAIGWDLPGGKTRRLTRAVAVPTVLLVLLAGVCAASFWPLPSFQWSRGEIPAGTAAMELEIGGLECRGNANLLVFFLDRDDLLEVEGYLGLEAWPGPGLAVIRITYDPSRTQEAAIKAAIVEPYLDLEGGKDRLSPFSVEGFDPLEDFDPLNMGEDGG